MKLSLRIPLSLTVIVVMGIIAFVKLKAKGGPFQTPHFFIWIVGSVIPIGTAIWSWLRNRKE